MDNPTGSHRVTASLVFHHLSRPGSFPGSIIIRNSIFASKVPLPDHSQIFIARAFTSISFRYFFVYNISSLRHDVAKLQCRQSWRICCTAPLFHTSCRINMKFSRYDGYSDLLYERELYLQVLCNLKFQYFCDQFCFQSASQCFIYTILHTA